MKHTAAIAVCTLLLNIPLLAYQDTDMDGVEDALDKCPNTPFMALVDQEGCTTHALVSPNHFDIMLGENYSQMNYLSNEKSTTYTSSLQVDYYRNDFSAQLTASYYTSDANGTHQSGMNNTTASVSYSNHSSNTTLITTTLGAIFPTYKTGYDNEAIDPFLGISVNHTLNDQYDLFGGYTYTLIREKDVPLTVSYQNTNAFNAGIRRNFGNTVSFCASYNQSDSMYVGTKTIRNVSLFSYYQVSDHWFTTLVYAHGLTDSTSKHDATLRLGYYF